MSWQRPEPKALTRQQREAELEKLAEPEMFRMWLGYRAKMPMITGMYAYCEANGFGTNPNGHWVRNTEIYAGYRGHRICKACAEKYYGHIERDAQERAGVQDAG